jgi:hypothetical protein
LGESINTSADRDNPIKIASMRRDPFRDLSICFAIAHPEAAWNENCIEITNFRERLSCGDNKI